MIFQLGTKALLFCTIGTTVFVTVHPAIAKLDLRTDLWKKEGEYPLLCIDKSLGTTGYTTVCYAKPQNRHLFY